MGTEEKIILKVFVIWGLVACLLGAGIVLAIDHLRLVWVP